MLVKEDVYGDFEPASWPGMLAKLLKGIDLEEREARELMGWVLAGYATPAQIGALLVALKSKGESAGEMYGFVQAMLDVAERVDPGYTVLDTCGTGGDGTGTINISTIAAFVAAGAGAKVCKHGGRAASSQAGSADLLEELGVVIDLDAAGVAKCIDGAGMGFCFAPTFHPAMRHAAPVRRELGVPTVFNLLGPLANPAIDVRQVVGVPAMETMQKMGQVLSRKGCERAMVVRGDDGMDELSLCARSTVLEITEGGEIAHFEIYPADFGFELVPPEAISGGDVKRNAEIALSVLAGEKSAYRDVVVLNAAAATVVAGLVASFEEGIELSSAVLDEGRARSVLDDLVRLSHQAVADGQ
ncbi:MAG: anthranilate phosphoribosyltransferase [Acidimicrobiales bacterium]